MRHVSDPVPVTPRHRRGRVISMPIIVIILCAIAGLPPIASRLMSLDSTIHMNNDTIVSWLLVAMPFLCVLLAISGLYLVFKKPKPAIYRDDDFIDPPGKLPNAPPPRRTIPTQHGNRVHP